MTLRILFLAANPVDTEPLRLGEEARLIEQRLREGDKGSKVEFTSHWATRKDDLAEVMLRTKPHVVHFSGHGQADGVVFQDEFGQSQVVSGGALAELMGIVGNSLQCVVLNACFTEHQAEALAQHVDVVIGTRQEITDDGARGFAAGFYRGISFSRDIQECFELGTNEVDLNDLPDSAVPRLLSKTGVDPKHLTVHGDGWWTRARVATLAGVATLALVAILMLPNGNATSARNIELVVDGSLAMAEVLDGVPRLQELDAAVAEFTDGATHTALGLRMFGNECPDDPIQLVPLGVGQSDRVREAVASIQPTGQADLVSAVRASVDVFSNPEIYPPNLERQHVQTRVVVITSSADGCDGGDLSQVEEEAAKLGIDLEFKWIGFDVDGQVEDELISLAADVGGDLVIADTGEEVRRILDEINIAAFRDDTNALTDLINRVSGPINEAFSSYIAAVNAHARGNPIEGELAAARDALEEAVAEMEATEAQYLALENPGAPDAYREMWNLDGTLREIQVTQTGQVRELIALLESGESPIDDEGEAVAIDDRFRELADELRDGNRQFRALQDQFIDSLQG